MAPLPVGRLTTAVCFASLVRPFIMSAHDFQARKYAVMSSCLAWNIGLFATSDQREQQIDIVWKLEKSENLKAESPLVECEFKRDLRLLSAQRRDLFPWQTTYISLANLAEKNGNDVLLVSTEGTLEEVDLVWQSGAYDLATIINTLQRLRTETNHQIDRIRMIQHAGGTLNDIETTHLTTMYCVQRANLVDYRRTMAAYLDVHATARAIKGIDCWIEMLDEIDENSRALLSMLTGDAQIMNLRF